MIINAWLLYKRSSQQKGNPSTMKLSDFRTELGVSLCKQGKPITPGRGRPRNEIEDLIKQKKKKGPAAPGPPKDIQLDQLSHWQEFTDSHQRCKHPNCTAKTFSKCTKCNVYLCFHNKKNCFHVYHHN